jgi:SulP family sulfate permease
MRLVPRPVMVGFVNALAILIFIAQVPNITHHRSFAVYLILAIGLGLIFLVPRVTTVIPAPLVAIVVLTGAVTLFHTQVPTVEDMGALPSSLPGLSLPDVPFTLRTLGIIAPYALSMAVVGLVESLLTARLIDEITDTRSNKDQECRGQGIANIAAAMVAGLPGCAMIGQSMINMQSGGRTRLSTLSAGVFLILLLAVFGGVVSVIPVAVLVAVMVVVCIRTFDWSSIQPATLRATPRGEIFVMVVTVAIVVATGNLAYGVVAGVLLSGIFFARRIGHLIDVTKMVDASGATVYAVRGELFFASTHTFTQAIDYTDDGGIVLDLTHAHVWDSTAVEALDLVVGKFQERGATVTITGLNAPSAELHTRLTSSLAAR